MHDYAAYGLTIRSEIALPELASASGSMPMPGAFASIQIVRAPIVRRPPAPFAPDAAVWATSQEAFLDYPGIVAFWIREGQRIIIDAADDADPRLIRLYLLGPALALLLHQRQYLVLHASAVSINGCAAAFVGDKGAGKSTMAAALHAAGYPLVADDLVAVQTTGDRLMALPGIPQFKLFPDSAALFGGNISQLPRVHPDLDKRARPATERFPTQPLPLARLFVLEDGDREAIVLKPGGAGFMDLVQHSYLLGFLQATGAAAAHFHQAATVASRVPVARLIRRRSLQALPTLVHLIEEELERGA